MTAPATPDGWLRARERNARWCAERRNCKRRNPWLFGAFPYYRHLPGGALPMRITPMPEKVTFAHSRHVHGMISHLSGAHHPTIPEFALIPWQSGWAVYFRDAERAVTLAGKTRSVRLWDRDASVAFGPLHQIKAPVVTKRGRMRVRVDAISPICIRESGFGMYTAPTADVLRSCLEAWQARRVDVRCPEGHLKLELISRETQPATTDLGGKFGSVRGWVGHVVVEVNAPALWLLLVAERIGFGGRVAFGFGRIRVSGPRPDEG